MKVFFFVILAAMLGLSAAGVNNDLVAFTGCTSATAFSALVIREFYLTFKTINHDH